MPEDSSNRSRFTYKPSIALLILIYLIICIFSFTVAFFLKKNSSRSTAKETLKVLNTQTVSEESFVSDKENTSHFFLYTNEGSLYNSQVSEESLVTSLLNNQPVYSPNNSTGKISAFQSNTTTSSIFPLNIINNSYLIRKHDSNNDQVLTAQGISLNTTHYIYNQTIGGIPVYGAVFGIHLKDGNKVYSLEGKLTKNSQVTAQVISEDKAKSTALEQAEKDKKDNNINLKAAKSDKYIINNQILGASNDATNYLTQGVTVVSSDPAKPFATLYFVDLGSGKIIRYNQLIKTAIDRNIYDYDKEISPDPKPGKCINYRSEEICSENCAPPSVNNCAKGICCEKFPTPTPGIFGYYQIARTEGSNPISDVQVDSGYDWLGKIYNFYKSHGRDGFDNNGHIINTLVKLQDWVCPNAWWDGYDETLTFCEGMMVPDVLGHEYTHGVVQFTAALDYWGQAGAIEESLADIFGSSMDNNWLNGESTSLGVIRNISHPELTPKRDCDTYQIDPNGLCAGPQPDRLFSSFYDCGEEVHQNNGILNKAFYLMSDGGNFNNCAISGIGKDKAFNIMYRAMTVYLHTTSNYKSVQDAVTAACVDLYGFGNTCNQVKSAFQATEMDQQPDNESWGALCSSITRVEPKCASLPSPTPTRVPPTVTGPTPSSRLTPTNIPPGAPTSAVPTSLPTIRPTAPPSQCQGCFYNKKCYAVNVSSCLDGFKWMCYSDGRFENTNVSCAIPADQICSSGPPTSIACYGVQYDTQSPFFNCKCVHTTNDWCACNVN